MIPVKMHGQSKVALFISSVRRHQMNATRVASSSSWHQCIASHHVTSSSASQLSVCVCIHDATCRVDHMCTCAQVSHAIIDTNVWIASRCHCRASHRAMRCRTAQLSLRARPSHRIIELIHTCQNFRCSVASRIALFASQNKSPAARPNSAICEFAMLRACTSVGFDCSKVVK